MKIITSLLLALATSLLAQTPPAQPATPEPAPPAATPAPTPAPAAKLPPKDPLYPDTKLDSPNADNEGVVLAYVKGTMPVEGEEISIALQDTIMVRIRNLDGWLIRRLESRHFSGEPVMSSIQRDAYFEMKKLRQTLTTEDFLKYYEDGIIPVNKDGTPKPLPEGWKWPDFGKDKAKEVKRLRDGQNAFRSLLDYTKSQLYLVINSSHLAGIQPENPEVGVSNTEAKSDGNTVHELAFRIRRFDSDAKEWDKLYDSTRAIHDVKISLGIKFEKTPAAQTFTLSSAVHPAAAKPVQRVKFELYSSTWLRSVLIALAILFGALILLGKNTDLLRDSDLQTRADGLGQFSIARVQLAFWIFLCVGSFLIIWLVTDRLDTLNPTVLTLLGISSATMLASKLANTFTLTGGSIPPDPARRARSGEHLATLKARLATERGNLRKLADRVTRNKNTTKETLEKLHYRIEQNERDAAYLEHNACTRFFVDLLSENGRVSLNRMQILVWTLVLGVVFITRVKRELAMPVFSETLLGLMGLSSATYVALKVPELKKTEAQAAANKEGK